VDLGISGRSAIVTGGSLGIGRAIAAELARNGVRVVVAARDAPRLEQAAKDLSAETGGRVVPIPCNMSKAQDILRMVDAAREALGQIDILINNAGACPVGRIHELTDEQWHSSFDLKLMGYVRCARAVLPEMRERKWGRIINIVGRGAEIATPGYLLGAFNAALLHFSRALALETARDKVLVNAVNPGATNTPRWHAIVAQKASASGRTAQEVEAQWHASVPLGKAAEPEDVANMVVFLCSERARHLAGASFNVDGGGAAGV